MGKVIMWIHDLCKWIIGFIEAPMGTLWFIRLTHSKRETHHVVLFPTLGDAIYALSYLNEYKQKNGIPDITIVACDYIKQVCDYYKDVYDNAIYIPKRQLRSLINFSRTIIGQNLCYRKYREKILFTNWVSHLSRRFEKNNPYLSMHQYIKMLYQIAPDTKAQTPLVLPANITPFLRKYEIEKGRTVLLNPYANSVSRNVTVLFEKIAEGLIEKGYTVITMTATGTQKAVYNTKAMPCTLSEAFYLAEYAGHVIGFRSGFMDVLVFAKAQIISIDDIYYEDRLMCDLEKWNVNEECHTVVYEEDEQKTAQEVFDIICGKS